MTNPTTTRVYTRLDAIIAWTTLAIIALLLVIIWFKWYPAYGLPLPIAFTFVYAMLAYRSIKTLHIMRKIKKDES